MYKKNPKGTGVCQPDINNMGNILATYRSYQVGKLAFDISVNVCGNFSTQFHSFFSLSPSRRENPENEVKMCERLTCENRRLLTFWNLPSRVYRLFSFSCESGLRAT